MKNFKLHLARSIGKLSKAVNIFLLLALVCNDWGMQAAIAASPMLDLKLSGSQQSTGRQIALVKQPFGINVQLVNPGEARQDARLRFFIHQEGGVDHFDVKASDIKVEVLEGASWVRVPVEPVDGGVIGAIGLAEAGHRDIHQHGGFAIMGKLDMSWQLRITFRLPGAYQLVVAVSSDDGDTHLAQPTFITLEAL